MQWIIGAVLVPIVLLLLSQLVDWGAVRERLPGRKKKKLGLEELVEKPDDELPPSPALREEFPPIEPQENITIQSSGRAAPWMKPIPRCKCGEPGAISVEQRSVGAAFTTYRCANGHEWTEPT